MGETITIRPGRYDDRTAAMADKTAPERKLEPPPFDPEDLGDWPGLAAIDIQLAAAMS